MAGSFKLHCYGCSPLCASLTCLFKLSFRFVPSVATLLLQPASLQGQKYRGALESCISAWCRSRPVWSSNARLHWPTVHLYGRVCFLTCFLMKGVSQYRRRVISGMLTLGRGVWKMWLSIPNKRCCWPAESLNPQGYCCSPVGGDGDERSALTMSLPRHVRPVQQVRWYLLTGPSHTVAEDPHARPGPRRDRPIGRFQL